jgi:predicted DNA-binding transcriptional regulator YafY
VAGAARLGVGGRAGRSERTVWPIQLGFMDLARVLVPCCEMRQAFRFFRTDRLASAVDGESYPARRVDLVRRFQDAISMIKVATPTPEELTGGIDTILPGGGTA